MNGAFAPNGRHFMVEIIGNPIIENAIQHQSVRAQLGGMAAERLIDSVPWGDMSPAQRKICIRHTVSQVETEHELQQRLQADFDIYDACINWYLPEEGDQTGKEAQMLVKALGGLIAKNGALVQIMTFDDLF